MNRYQKLALWSGVILFFLFAIFMYPQPQVTVGFMGFGLTQIDYHPYAIGLLLIALVTATAVVTLADRKTRS